MTNDDNNCLKDKSRQSAFFTTPQLVLPNPSINTSDNFK